LGYLAKRGPLSLWLVVDGPKDASFDIAFLGDGDSLARMDFVKMKSGEEFLDTIDVSKLGFDVTRLRHIQIGFRSSGTPDRSELVNFSGKPLFLLTPPGGFGHIIDPKTYAERLEAPIDDVSGSRVLSLPTAVEVPPPASFNHGNVAVDREGKIGDV